jgi:hypothetical protein
MPDPLDTNHILELLPTLLPRSTSSPLPHTTDALAALVHTIHTALSFRLIRPAEQEQEAVAPHAREQEADFDDGASETTTAVDQDEAEGDDVEGRLWTGWNHRAEDSYSFEYKHEQSSMTFRLRVGRMGGRVQIDAMAEVSIYNSGFAEKGADRQDGAPHTLSVVVRDLLLPAAFPIPSAATSSGSSTNAESPAKSLGFASIARYVLRLILKMTIVSRTLSKSTSEKSLWSFCQDCSYQATPNRKSAALTPKTRLISSGPIQAESHEHHDPLNRIINRDPPTPTHSSTRCTHPEQAHTLLQ